MDFAWTEGQLARDGVASFAEELNDDILERDRIDRHQPAQRIGSLIEDSSSTIVVTAESLCGELGDTPELALEKS